MIPYEHQLRNYAFDVETVKSHHKDKNGNYKVQKFNNSIITFDIETSSAWVEDGKVIGYRAGEPEEYWNSLEPISLCYIWQLSVDGIVYYGRELKDFIKVIEDIPSDLQTVIWVHNLSFEFGFLSDIFEWHNVFARSPHKPMKCVPCRFNNIEFRCSYMLTRLSLATWGEQLGFPKKVGDLDYDVLRTPWTPLTKTELDYCEVDCLVLHKGIKEYLKRYGKIRNIPLTQTGTVRREVKDRLTSDAEYVKFIKRLVPVDADEYKMLQEIFAGGYTHANRFWAGHIIQGLIQHYDFASSYPTVMICEKFPMTPWQYTGWKHLPKKELFDDYAYIIHLKFNNIESTSFNTYLQHSKCVAENVQLDNGRIIKAKSCELYITEQDLITIQNNYKYDSVEVYEVYESKKDYLPIELRKYILELYKNKTELKDVEGQEELYMQSKQYINSMFGMCVTAIVQADCELNNDIWSVKELTREYVEKKLSLLRHYNPREKRYFLSYSWGCWVTAYARRNLWECMESVDHDVIYVDTDSIFVLGEKDFSWYNEKVTNKLRKACEDTGIDFELTRPKTKAGKPKPLGVFAREDDCCEFITLGAKRYCERRASDNRLYLTISGINKDAVELLQNDISKFKDGFYFDKDSMLDGKVIQAERDGIKFDCVTKKMHTYLYDMPDITWHDGYHSTYKKGINLRRAGYTLGITDEYKELIKYLDYTIDDLPDYYFISARGRFC